MTRLHLAVTISNENGGMDKEKLCEIKRTIANSGLGKIIRGAMELPRAVETIRAAKTPTGRAIKTLLFGLGMAAPLGILVVALLFWHGSRVCGRSLHPLAT